jgi:uncharacterized protein YabN with tetrapyrrole methylase and pyrophosphatase domain
MMALSADITLVGAGLKLERQLTGEAKAALGESRYVFYSKFNGDIPAYLAKHNAGATAVDIQVERGLFQIGAYRPTVYDEMAAAVVAEARKGGGVVVLEPGSAVTVDMFSALVLKRARDIGLSVDIIAGVSCIETVLTSLGYDAGHGLQVLQAQKMMLYGHCLNPALAGLIIQPGYYDTLYWVAMARSRPGRFDLLAGHLADSYSTIAPAALVRSALDSSTGDDIFWLELGDLPRAYQAITPYHTLFIPPTKTKEVTVEFEQRITTWAAAFSQVQHAADGEIAQADATLCSATRDRVSADLRAKSVHLADRWRNRSLS